MFWGLTSSCVFALHVNENERVCTLLQLLLLGNKFQRMAEYSESRSLAVRPVINELVAERVAALPAEDLQGGDLGPGRDVHQALVSLYLLGQGVDMDRIGECWPGRMVFVLLCAEEKVSPSIIFFYQTIFTSRKEDNHTCCTRKFPHWNCLYGSPVSPKSKKTFWNVLSEMYIINDTLKARKLHLTIKVTIHQRVQAYNCGQYGCACLVSSQI